MARILSAPREIDDDVLRFCRGISPEAPFYVPVKPVSKGKMSRCFDNVARQIKRRRGSIAYGWAIWHWPGRYFEAEHHAIWRSPAGFQVDVSPQLDGRKRVLFLPDPEAVYEPSAVRSNILGVDGDDPTATEFVALGCAWSKIRDSYRIEGMTAVMPTFADNARLCELQSRMNVLLAQMEASEAARDRVKER